jgi:hypothetical protein
MASRTKPKNSGNLAGRGGVSVVPDRKSSTTLPGLEAYSFPRFPFGCKATWMTSQGPVPSGLTPAAFVQPDPSKKVGGAVTPTYAEML